MADDPPSPHGLAALAISVSFVQALLKQGLIDHATRRGDPERSRPLRPGALHRLLPEVERETMRIVKQIKPEIAVADAIDRRGRGPGLSASSRDAADPHKNGV